MLRFRGLSPPSASSSSSSWRIVGERVRVVGSRPHRKEIGLTDEEIDAVRTTGRSHSTTPPSKPPSTSRAGRRPAAISTTTSTSAEDALGDRMLIEVLTLVGYYALLALQMRVHRVPLPEGANRSFT